MSFDRLHGLAHCGYTSGAACCRALPNEDRRFTLDDVVGRRQRDEGVGFHDDVAHAGGGFAADKSHSSAGRRPGSCDARAMGSAVAGGGWGVGNGASVLVADAPCRFTADENGRASGSHEWRAVHSGIAESGSRLSQSIFLLASYP